MSLSGSGTVIQVNGANFTVADATKELRANLIRFSTTSSGLSLSSLNGNVYTASNVSAGYYYGNAKHLVSLTDAAAGTYGGSDAAVAGVVVDATGRITDITTRNITLSNVVDSQLGANITSNTVQFTNAGVSLKATGEINAGSFVGDGSGLTNLTGASADTYGSETQSAAIVVDGNGRITGITNKTIVRDTFSNVVARGASTANVVTFSNNGNAILVTNASGKVGIANSAPGHALSVGTKFYVDKGATSTNVAVVNGNVAATYYYGNAKHLVNTTDVSDGTYGSSTVIPAITITNGRVASIATNTIDVTLQGVSDTGNTTSNTLQFTNSGTSLITSGKVGISNSAPEHDLAVGDNFYVGSDGGAVASYFSGDGANVTNIVGSSTVKGVTHGGSTSVPTIQIDSDGKITQIANTTIAQNLQAVTENGNTTTEVVDFQSGIAVTGDSSISFGSNINIGSSVNWHNVNIGQGAGDSYQGYKAIAIGVSAGRMGQNNNSIAIGLNAGDSAQGALSIAIGDNAGNFGQGSGSIAIGRYAGYEEQHDNTIILNATGSSLNSARSDALYMAPVADLDTTSNVLTYDTSSKEVVKSLAQITSTGAITATSFTGDGGFLSNLSELTSSSGSFGSASKVPVITFDDNGRISAMSTVDVQSNVNSAATGELAFYTSSTQVAGFSDLTKDNSNLTLQGTFTAEDIFVNGNLHVTGNTVVHDHVVIEDPILTVGNVNEATTQSVGTVFSRSDANVALFYNKSSDGQAANKLTFGYTTSTGAGADIIIDSSRILESKFYGNVVATANITATDTITASSFVGSGAQLTNIDFGAVDNNAETRLATAENDIDNLETSNTAIHIRMATAENDIDNLETSNTAIHGRVATAETDIDNLETSNVAIHGRMATAENDIDNLETSNVAIHGRMATAENDIDNLETSNVAIHGRMATAETDIDNLETSNVAIHGRMATAETDINTLETNTTNISYSSLQTTIGDDLIVGAIGTFFVDTSDVKVGISNTTPSHELTVGANFYVDATNDVVSTIGSTLNTGGVEVVGDSSTIDFKSTTGETADCRISKSGGDLILSTGNDGENLTTAMTVSGDTQNVTFSNSITVTNNVVTNALLFSGTASIQAAQISLEDVLAVSNSTTLDIITTGNVNTFNLLATGTKNFNIKHPIVEGKRLQHACIETARADNVYMGSVVLVHGKAEVDLDIVNKMTPGTFEALNKDIRVFTTNESDWDAVKGKVECSKLRIDCQNGESSAKVSWLVAGTRTDIDDLVVEV